MSEAAEEEDVLENVRVASGDALCLRAVKEEREEEEEAMGLNPYTDDTELVTASRVAVAVVNFIVECVGEEVRLTDWSEEAGVWCTSKSLWRE